MATQRKKLIKKDSSKILSNAATRKDLFLFNHFRKKFLLEVFFLLLVFLFKFMLTNPKIMATLFTFTAETLC